MVREGPGLNRVLPLEGPIDFRLLPGPSTFSPSLLQFATFKNQKELKKSDGTKRQRLLGKETG